MSDSAVLDASPAERLEKVFRAAAVRMAGLPVSNLALRVEAVGFAEWEGCWLGVIVTPWCMNLVLAPRDSARWTPLAPGDKRRYRFPAGEYEFVGAADAVAGEYQVCSLASPLPDFDDHETARQVASLAREALLDPANADPAAPVGARRPGPLARLEAGIGAPLSKRDFLRGAFLGADRDDRG
jgi:[NiFe] hydrogenase assembly HybE family chaperone